MTRLGIGLGISNLLAMVGSSVDDPATAGTRGAAGTGTAAGTASGGIG